MSQLLLLGKRNPSLPLVILGAALAIVTAAAADEAEDRAILARMAGAYSDPSVIIRSEFPGNPPNFFPASMRINLPKGRGPIRGSIFDGTGELKLVGSAREARVRGKKVIISGNLRVAYPGAILQMRNFRAVASPSGPNREILSSGIKFTGSILGTVAVVTTNFRGTK